MTIFLILGLFAGLYLLWLLFHLAVYALPFAAGISVAFWMRDHDFGFLAATSTALCRDDENSGRKHMPKRNSVFGREPS